MLGHMGQLEKKGTRLLENLMKLEVGSDGTVTEK